MPIVADRTTSVVWRRQIFFVAVCLLALAATKLAIQDFSTFCHPVVNDLTSPWVSSILFMKGKNPYSDTDGFARIWSSTHLSPLPDFRRIILFYRRLYPPTTLLLITPLGLMKWPVAVRTFLCVSFGLFVVALLILARDLALPTRDPRRLYFIAFALALAPLYSGLHTANISTLVMAFLCAGVGLMNSRPILSGIALAVAVCLKPQVAILFLAYLVLRKKWKAALAAFATCAVIGAASLLWLGVHHIQWFDAWRSEIHLCSTGSGGCSIYGPGLERLQFLNFETLVFEFTKNAQSAKTLSWMILIPVFAIAFLLIHLRVSSANESTGIAIISVLTLLPFYQNTYSGEILLFVLYWAVENWPSMRARITRYLMVLLLIPPFSALEQKVGFLARFVANNHLDSSLFWNGFLMLHIIWLELFFLLLLSATLYRTSRPNAESPA